MQRVQPELPQTLKFKASANSKNIKPHPSSSSPTYIHSNMKAPITSTVLFLSAGTILASGSPLENRDLLDSATSAVGGAFNTATSAVGGAFSTATSGAVGVFSTATSGAAGEFTSATSAVGGAYGSATSAVGSEVAGTRTASASAVSAASGRVGGMNWVGVMVGVTVGVLGGLVFMS